MSRLAKPCWQCSPRDALTPLRDSVP